eukprot:TRINITY_DN60641_c0_g1_i1.p1 TRINITY_DN60641_c0_g1~~TRINITY_DN60641_c0_g1_i1.p1  ORF type:complete len:492 (+),score=89.56 TRINITY_DN60641_c0_g1_i1:44-1519(+)
MKFHAFWRLALCALSPDLLALGGFTREHGTRVQSLLDAQTLWFDPSTGISRCDVPDHHGAACVELNATGVDNLKSCAVFLRSTGVADTLNFLFHSDSYGVCITQRCGPAGSDPLAQRSAGTVPHLRVGQKILQAVKGLHVYSYRCNPITPLLKQRAVIHGDQGRSTDYYTSSRQFKQDLRDFFGSIARDWTVVELGAYRGYTTRVLSEVFGHVIAVDASATFLTQNRRHNSDRKNIMYLQLHSAVDGLQSLQGNSVEVVFVDADHDYSSVLQDVNSVFSAFGTSLRYLLFDDFFSSEGIRQVVTELVSEGKAQIGGGLGKRPPFGYEWISKDGSSTETVVVNRWEGIALEVLTGAAVPLAAATPGIDKVVGRWYHWLESNLLCSDANIFLKADGEVIVPWGTGRWHREEKFAGENRGETFIGILFDWQASDHKDAMHRQWAPGKWLLRFSETGEKFMAVFTSDHRRNAAGVSEDMLSSLRRRLFLSVDLES